MRRLRARAEHGAGAAARVCRFGRRASQVDDRQATTVAGRVLRRVSRRGSAAWSWRSSRERSRASPPRVRRFRRGCAARRERCRRYRGALACGVRAPARARARSRSRTRSSAAARTCGFGDLDPAWSSRQAKLYTRAGMGPCQGRICGAALESIMGWTADSVRPPVHPTQLATMLGDARRQPSARARRLR